MPKRVWTQEQREAARQRAKARVASGNASTTAVADRPEADDEPSNDDVLSQLEGLFRAARGQKSGRDKAITQALDVLGQLDPSKYPDIADNPTVQAFVEQVQAARSKSTDVPPGAIMGNGLASFKKPWTWTDLKKGMNVPVEEVTRRAQAGEVIFPWVEYTPIKTTSVTWNGLTVYFKARQRVYVCKAFVDVFEESLNQEEFAEQHAAWLFNTPGVQGRTDFFTTNAPRVKAMDMGKGEYFVPGGGMIAMPATVADEGESGET